MPSPVSLWRSAHPHRAHPHPGGSDDRTNPPGSRPRSTAQNLDILPGGSKLEELEDILIGRSRRAGSDGSVLAESLAPIADDYDDLIIIDTPPTRPYLLSLTLAATRWILIPGISLDVSRGDARRVSWSGWLV
ncbi:AAA family ATPase [Gordonia sp. L191]|uniref:AAA family ATPase n=1 Tax=Gordonia sp. L191 TaxID=2982699 RepID=UPI0024BFD7B5|nr:AAA family ATPase [Gordonia sp. L191]WHU47706.1 AAA family ATPase [Gordonia sp. L191]